MEQTKAPYRIVREGGEGAVEEKKSKFIAAVRPARSIEEAEAFIEERRKKYWDARHHCYAFILGERSELSRCSDDGEPSGTAGRPMLEVLKGEGLTDTVMVVTRYFGGTLLGAGGLVRAYTRAAKAGLAACPTAVMRYGARLYVQADYNGAQRLKGLLSQNGIPVENTDYGQDVRFLVSLPSEREEWFRKAAAEATGGRAVIEEAGRGYYLSE